jgi:hypothetical protein
MTEVRLAFDERLDEKSGEVRDKERLGAPVVKTHVYHSPWNVAAEIQAPKEAAWLSIGACTPDDSAAAGTQIHGAKGPAVCFDHVQVSELMLLFGYQLPSRPSVR